jgi:hypothetical protein
MQLEAGSLRLASSSQVLSAGNAHARHVKVLSGEEGVEQAELLHPVDGFVALSDRHAIVSLIPISISPSSKRHCKSAMCQSNGAL